MADADPKITVPVAELRANLSRYLKKVEDGATFIIMSRGRAVAVLKPDDAPKKLPPRQFGLMKGEIWIADDFDDPMPQDFLDAYYNNEL